MNGRLVVGFLQQNPGRLLVSVAAVALGVALGFAVQIINGSAIGEFMQAARVLSGDADLTIRGPRDGFDETLYPAIVRHEGVIAASPAVEVDAAMVGREEPLRIIGLDIFRAARLQPALVGEADDSLDTLRPDAVFLSAESMRWLGVVRGDTVRVRSGLQQRPLRVAGALGAAAGTGRIAVMDIAAAQSLFGRVGRITRIDLRLRAGVEAERFARGLRLPPGVTVELPRDAGDATGRMTRAYRVNLNVLALVALFTGGLLVLSTQALSVARRRSQIALLRVIGHTRRQIIALILTEGAIVGSIGAALGLVAGYAVARAALSVLGADLGAGFFRGVMPSLRIDPIVAAVFASLGVLAALAGSAGPAMEAARADPARALKPGDDARAFARLPSAWPGLLLLIAGAGLSQLPPVGGLPWFGYLSIAILLFGAILLLPRLTRLLAASLPLLRQPMARLAVSRLRAYPSQAAVSLAAIVAATSLLVAMVIMVTSFRASLTDWLDGVLPADLYLRAAEAGDSAFLSWVDQQRIAAVPGIDRVEFLRWSQIVLDERQPRVTLLARDGVEADAERRLPVVGPIVPPPAGMPAVWPSEAAASLQGLVAGQVLDIPLGGRMHRFHVAGLWRDYARQNGAVLIDRATYRALTADDTANDAGIWLRSGASLSTVRAALDAIAPGGVVLMAPDDIRRRSLDVFDRTFAVTYVLEVAALLIGLLGLSAAIAAEVLSRRREFGMLRHIGVTRRQIAALLGIEGVTVAGVGLVVGCVVGFGMSLILIHVVNRQSFHWGMELHVPWGALAAFVIGMLVLAAATAIGSGRQAMSGDVVQAVREDA